MIEWAKLPGKGYYARIDELAHRLSIAKYKGKWVVYEDPCGDYSPTKARIVATAPTLKGAKVLYLIRATTE